MLVSPAAEPLNCPPAVMLPLVVTEDPLNEPESALSVNAMVCVAPALSRKVSAPAEFHRSPEAGEVGAATATGMFNEAAPVVEVASVSSPAIVRLVRLPTLVNDEFTTELF